jgi:adenylate cyclase
MSAEVKKEIQLEIGHVLFTDIVGYSKLLINEQRALLDTLNQVVRGTDQFRGAEAAERLIKIPTGDGMALVFYNTAEAPVECALEISRALKTLPSLQLRMGVHSGPVSGVVDVNERANVAGAGINVAQRVMDCGDAGHILLSKHVAEDLEQYGHWQPHLHDLGECEVKHGVRVRVVNLYTEELGNPEVPEKFKQAAGASKAAAAISGPSERPTARRWGMVGAVLLMIVAVVTGLLIFLAKRSPTGAITSTATPEKSIAVLPFENLSHDPDNVYFADGIQEEILTRLSKIADLKVISRTSTQRYQHKPENLLEIAKQLGVANILEGSVQKAADQVRVNVQLINAQNDSHLWADKFDRKLTDIFAVESEIAAKIADALQARLTAPERNAIAAQPTQNTEAHQLYLKGRYLWNRRTGENLKKALAYFQLATEKDSNYALAYVGVADAYSVMPAYSAGSPQDCLPRARAAAQRALELDEMLAEAHASLAYTLFHYFEFAASTKEFERAIELNPNYATAHQWYARTNLLMTGQFDRAIAEMKRAVELDPVSPMFHAELGGVYMVARRYDEAIEQLRNTIETDPEFYWAHRFLGLALELKGATAQAIAEYHRAFEVSDDPVVLAFLAHAEANIGRQNEARQILARLTEAAKTRYVPAYAFAVIHLALGEKDQALDWLEKNTRDHAAAYSLLIKVDPYLDPLRGEPRFETLVSAILSGSVK